MIREQPHPGGDCRALHRVCGDRKRERVLGNETAVDHPPAGVGTEKCRAPNSQGMVTIENRQVEAPI